MHPIFYITLSIMSVSTLIMLAYILTVALKNRKGKLSRTPRISILIAARDEEDNILHCLESIAAMDYPAELMEVLIGDDASEDRTGELVQGFVAGHPGFRYFRIEEHYPNVYGKQNVLAKLAHEATGDYFLVTDADIRVGKDWAARLMGGFQEGKHPEKTGMVSGPTLVEGEGLLGSLQSLDWMMGIGIARAHDRMGIPLTGVGNNMAVSREAYFSIGGYENIPFSIVEDFRLFQYMCLKGEWNSELLLDTASLCRTQPMPSVAELMRQRRRWFKGGQELPWYNLAAIGFNTLIVPTLILGSFFNPLGWTLAFWGLKLGLDLGMLLTTGSILNYRKKIGWFLPYELYYMAMTVVVPIQQLIPRKVVWKGREY